MRASRQSSNFNIALDHFASMYGTERSVLENPKRSYSIVNFDEFQLLCNTQLEQYSIVDWSLYRKKKKYLRHQASIAPAANRQIFIIE